MAVFATTTLAGNRRLRASYVPQTHGSSSRRQTPSGGPPQTLALQQYRS